MANKLENINCQEREQMVSRAFKRFHNTRKNPKRTRSLEYNNFLYLTFLPLYAFLQAIAHIFHVYVLDGKCAKKNLHTRERNTTQR